MDPTACLEGILDHIADGEWVEARYAMEDLNGWLVKGGFNFALPLRSESCSDPERMAVMSVLYVVITDGLKRQEDD